MAPRSTRRLRSGSCASSTLSSSRKSRCSSSSTLSTAAPSETPTSPVSRRMSSSARARSTRSSSLRFGDLHADEPVEQRVQHCFDGLLRLLHHCRSAVEPDLEARRHAVALDRTWLFGPSALRCVLYFMQLTLVLMTFARSSLSDSAPLRSVLHGFRTLATSSPFASSSASLRVVVSRSSTEHESMSSSLMPHACHSHSRYCFRHDDLLQAFGACVPDWSRKPFDPSILYKSSC